MLLALIDHYSNGNKAQFARLLGISPQGLNTWISRNTFDAELIYTKCEGISAQWLLSGKGIMRADANRFIPLIDADERKEYSIKPNKSTDLKPRIPFSAAAGALSIIADSVSFDMCEKFPTVTTFPRYDFTMIIHGDSMEPDFKSGDEVACQIIDDPRRIQWGRAHILDTMDGAVLKCIYDNEDDVICHSINPKYSDYSIPKVDILKVALVVGTLRRY